MSLQPIDRVKYRNTSNHTIATMASSTKRANEKQLVEFSVRAQDYILKKGLHNYSKSIDAGSEGLPFGVGSYGIKGPETNNFLEDGPMPNHDNYATDPDGNG